MSTKGHSEDKWYFLTVTRQELTTRRRESCLVNLRVQILRRWGNEG